MSREDEVVAFLSADTTLMSILLGGVYSYDALGVWGIRRGDDDPQSTDYSPTANAFDADGYLRPTALVRARALVPTGDLQSILSQHTSVSQAIEVWAYAEQAAAIQAALDHVYRLMMGKRLTGAFSATWIGGGIGIRQAPEMSIGSLTDHQDYRLVYIRRAVAA